MNAFNTGSATHITIGGQRVGLDDDSRVDTRNADGDECGDAKHDGVGVFLGRRAGRCDELPESKRVEIVDDVGADTIKNIDSYKES